MFCFVCFKKNLPAKSSIYSEQNITSFIFTMVTKLSLIFYFETLNTFVYITSIAEQ